LGGRLFLLSSFRWCRVPFARIKCAGLCFDRSFSKLVSISEVALELELRSEAPSTASSAQQAPKKNPDRHVPKTYPFRSLHFDVNMHVPFLPLTVQTFCAPISNALIRLLLKIDLASILPKRPPHQLMKMHM